MFGAPGSLQPIKQHIDWKAPSATVAALAQNPSLCSRMSGSVPRPCKRRPDRTICKDGGIVAFEQAAHKRQHALAVQPSRILGACPEDMVVHKRLLLAHHLRPSS